MEQMDLFEDFGIFSGMEVEEPAAGGLAVSEADVETSDKPPFEEASEEVIEEETKIPDTVSAGDDETDGELSDEPQDEDTEEEDEAEEGEVTASANEALKQTKPPLFGIEKAKAEVEEAKKKAAELDEVPEEELRERALTKLSAQYELSEKADPQKFGYIRIIYPHLLKTAEDAGFCKAVLAAGKDLDGMFNHVFEHFKAKAKAEFDALPEDEKKKLRSGNGGMCYASADDTELYGPAEEYFRTSDAEIKLAEAEKKLAELKEAEEKKAKKVEKKSSKKTEKKKTPKVKEEPGFSLFDVMEM